MSNDIKPDNCAACGQPTRSHNVAIDVSEHDVVGLPTLAGVVCHTCWSGGTDGVPAIGELVEEAASSGGEGATARLTEELDTDRLVATAVPVEELGP